MILIDTSAFVEFLNHTSSPFDKEIEYLISNDEDVAIADITITENCTSPELADTPKG